MKLPFAHVSRTALVVVAAAGAVWLSAFFLPGAGIQPAPLLPAIGSAAGKVVAVAEPNHAPKTVAAPHRAVATPVVARATFLPPASAPAAVQSKPRAVQRPHRANRPHPAGRPKHSAPVQTVASAPAPAPAVATTASVSSAAAPRGKAVGWHRKHELSTGAPAAAPTPKDEKSHGKHDTPHAEPATAPAPAAPAAPPPPAAHDNGKHRGDDHDHGDHGHGPGGKK